MYQALYRKWRPRTFDDVVGQSHITDTLKQQVAGDRLSHAYLFTGTRGTGKTTCAKILARAVCCEHPVNGSPCNACAACRFKSILSTTEEDFDSIVNANLKGYFFGTQAAAKLMIQTGTKGSIVLIGSVHSRGALPNRIPYAISKGGIEVMTRNCAYELGKYGIRVNCLVAGAIVNDKFLEQTEEEKEKRRANWPLGKESYPEDIAKSVYFLSSSEAATITGTSLVVDSGVSACLLQYHKDWENIG